MRGFLVFYALKPLFFLPLFLEDTAVTTQNYDEIQTLLRKILGLTLKTVNHSFYIAAGFQKVSLELRN